MGEQTEDILAGDETRQFGRAPADVDGTEARCITTELLVSQCGCRAHRGARPAPAQSTDPFESATDSRPVDGPGPWFPARFDSECSGCDGALWVGEDIRADGSGGWEGRCCGE